MQRPPTNITFSKLLSQIGRQRDESLSHADVIVDASGVGQGRRLTMKYAFSLSEFICDDGRRPSCYRGTAVTANQGVVFIVFDRITPVMGP